MRFIVAALLIANLAFYAWTQGWLEDVVGVRAEAEREPERLARQVHPELIHSLSPAEVAASGAASGMAAGGGQGDTGRARQQRPACRPARSRPPRSRRPRPRWSRPCPHLPPAAMPACTASGPASG